MQAWESRFHESPEEIYDEACTFTDEIDTYQKDKFIKGTKALFVASESNVQLVGDVDILEGGKKLQFRFQESLACRPQWCKACRLASIICMYAQDAFHFKFARFNFPIVHPKACS